MTQKSFLLAVAAVVAAVILGCGSDSETTSLTKAQFLKKANAICTNTSSQLSETFQRTAEETNGGQAGEGVAEKRQAFGEEISAGVQTMMDELSELGAPAGDEQKIEEILDAYGRSSEQIEEDVALFLTGKALDKPDQLAAAYGIKGCAGM
jgi:hypothetical protein